MSRAAAPYAKAYDWNSVLDPPLTVRMIGVYEREQVELDGRG